MSKSQPSKTVKKQRTGLLNSVLLPAGFSRHGDVWFRDADRVRWELSLAVVVDSQGPRYDVGMAAVAEPNPSDDAAPLYLVDQCLTDHKGSSRPGGYRELEAGDRDPLGVDARNLLLPLVNRLESPEGILEAWIELSLGMHHVTRSSRLSTAFRLATHLGAQSYVDRVRELAEVGEWTPGDRWVFSNAGLELPGPSRRPPVPGPFDWITRRSSRAYGYSD